MAFVHPLPSGTSYTEYGVDPRTQAQQYMVILPASTRISTLDAGLLADVNVLIKRKRIVKGEKGNHSLITEIVKRLGEVVP